MDNGERQRQMDFILDTLAEVSTKIGALTDAHARTDATVSEIAGQVQILSGQVLILSGQVLILTEQVQITDGQVQTIARQQAHINEVVAVIAESQQHTDERLNRLIDIVRNGRNGQS